jgi:hypothetical protein
MRSFTLMKYSIELSFNPFYSGIGKFLTSEIALKRNVTEIIVRLLKHMLIGMIIKVIKVVSFHQNPYIPKKKSQRIRLRFKVLITM